MRITSMELAGSVPPGQRLPRAFAVIVPGRAYGSVIVEIISAAGAEHYVLDIARPQNTPEMMHVANRLYETLDDDSVPCAIATGRYMTMMRQFA